MCRTAWRREAPWRGWGSQPSSLGDPHHGSPTVLSEPTAFVRKTRVQVSSVAQGSVAHISAWLTSGGFYAAGTFRGPAAVRLPRALGGWMGELEEST